MDQYFNGVSKSFTCKDDENLEAVELLDEYWFFENLLHRKTRMFRSASDPYPSTKTIPDMVFDTQDVKHSSTTTSPSKEESAVRHSLVRTPSLPPSIGRGVTEFTDTSINKEEVQVEVDHFRTSTPIIGRAEKDVISDRWSSRKLHRQASLSSSKVLPPLRAPKESSDPSMSMKSMAETFFETQVGKQNSSSIPTNPSSIERAAEVDSTSPSSGSRDQEKEVIIRRSPSKLTRQGSVSSSKAMQSQRVTTDSLDPYFSSKSMEETFFETQNANQASPFTNTMKEDTVARHNLLRAPSLPPLVGRDVDKDCIRRSSNKMTRQTSLCSSDALPPLRVPKSLIHSPGIPRHRAARSRDLKAENMTNDREVIRRSLSFKRTISSPKDLEVEEVQGFKDLGFVFNKEDLNKRLVDIIPGLQDKNPVEEQEDNKARRPYLSEAWLVQPPTPPPVPNWVERKTAGDMKSHLKYWARSVASNMRQEC